METASLISIDFLNPNEYAFVLYILLRVLGLFMISPLFSNHSINPLIRFFIGLFTSLILSLVLYPDYLGLHPRYVLADLNQTTLNHLLLVILISIKELATGYIIGFCFNVVFEAMVLTGELIDSMIGFSTAQFLDPFSFSFHSLLGQLFVLSGALMMLLVDFHHVFIRIIANSFNVIPIGHYQMSEALFNDLTSGTSLIFIYCVKYGVIGIIILFSQLLGIGFTVRVVPEMNLLLTGLPMRILFGFFVMVLTTGRIQPIFLESFKAVSFLAERIVQHLALFPLIQS